MKYDLLEITTYFILPVLVAISFYIFVKGHEAETLRNKDMFIFIERNSMGCERFQYNGDRYWNCPDNVNATEIEVGVGKRRRKEPVIKE